MLLPLLLLLLRLVARLLLLPLRPTCHVSRWPCHVSCPWYIGCAVLVVVATLLFV